MEKREYQAALNDRTLDAWGERSQLNMVVEEFAELIQALSKWQRKNLEGLPDEVVEELADVEIMIDQLKNICLKHDASAGERFDKVTQYKLQRLSQRLDAWQEAHK